MYRLISEFFMRKVLINRWIPITYETIEGTKRPIPGTGCMSQKFDTEAHFDSWGISYETQNDCNGNFHVMQCTVAIVVLSNGTIEEVTPSNLKFVTEDNKFVGTLKEFAKNSDLKTPSLVKEWFGERYNPKHELFAGSAMPLNDIFQADIVDEHGNDVAVVWGSKDYATEKLAKLMAAAPDLLEALKELHKWVCSLEDWKGIDPPVEKSLTAIKKATE